MTVPTIEKMKEIKRLREEADRLQREVDASQRSCSHNWGEAIYDPEEYREASDFRLVGRGSDVWTEPTSYQTKTKPRWRRRCKSCGKVEYTQQQVAVKYEPKF